MTHQPAAETRPLQPSQAQQLLDGAARARRRTVEGADHRSLLLWSLYMGPVLIGGLLVTLHGTLHDPADPGGNAFGIVGATSMVVVMVADAMRHRRDVTLTPRRRSGRLLLAAWIVAVLAISRLGRVSTAGVMSLATLTLVVAFLVHLVVLASLSRREVRSPVREIGAEPVRGVGFRLLLVALFVTASLPQLAITSALAVGICFLLCLGFDVLLPEHGAMLWTRDLARADLAAMAVGWLLSGVAAWRCPGTGLLTGATRAPLSPADLTLAITAGVPMLLRCGQALVNRRGAAR